MHRPLAIALGLMAVATGCATARLPHDARRVPHGATQHAFADVPRSLEGPDSITHDATMTALDDAHICFSLSLRAVEGEAVRLREPSSLHPRVIVDRAGSEVALEDATTRWTTSRTDDEAMHTLVSRGEPRTCGASAWSTLIPAAPLALIAPIPALFWLASEMPRHQRICRASERVGYEDAGEAEVVTVDSQLCFASHGVLARETRAVELVIDDPVAMGRTVRWRWQLSE